MTRHQSPRLRRAAVLTYLRQHDDATAGAISDAIGVGSSTVAHVLRDMEARGLITTRLETFEEARDRVGRMNKWPFIRPNARRRFLYRVVVGVVMLAAA